MSAVDIFSTVIMGGGGHVEIVLQISFAHHGTNSRRQIGEDIVIDIGACGTEHGWDQQQHGGRQAPLCGAVPPSAQNVPLLNAPFEFLRQLMPRIKLTNSQR